MIEALFLVVWSALFSGIEYVTFVKVQAHGKVYALIVLNCLYLCGIFLLYPLVVNLMSTP